MGKTWKKALALVMACAVVGGTVVVAAPNPVSAASSTVKAKKASKYAEKVEVSYSGYSLMNSGLIGETWESYAMINGQKVSTGTNMVLPGQSVLTLRGVAANFDAYPVKGEKAQRINLRTIKKGQVKRVTLKATIVQKAGPQKGKRATASFTFTVVGQ